MDTIGQSRKLGALGCPPNEEPSWPSLWWAPARRKSFTLAKVLKALAKPGPPCGDFHAESSMLLKPQELESLECSGQRQSLNMLQARLLRFRFSTYMKQVIKAAALEPIETLQSLFPAWRGQKLVYTKMY